MYIILTVYVTMDAKKFRLTKYSYMHVYPYIFSHAFISKLFNNLYHYFHMHLYSYVCTEEFKFLDLVDFGGVAFSAESVINSRNEKHAMCETHTLYHI